MERREYSREFNHEAVNLVTERGVSVVHASRNLDINHNALRTWVKAERDVLKTAAADFARDAI